MQLVVKWGKIILIKAHHSDIHILIVYSSMKNVKNATEKRFQYQLDNSLHTLLATNDPLLINAYYRN